MESEAIRRNNGSRSSPTKRPLPVGERPFAFASIAVLERIELVDALLLFLFAGGLVAQIGLGFLNLPGAGWIDGRGRGAPGLDVVYLGGRLCGFFSGGQFSAGGAYW